MSRGGQSGVLVRFSGFSPRAQPLRGSPRDVYCRHTRSGRENIRVYLERGSHWMPNGSNGQFSASRHSHSNVICITRRLLPFASVICTNGSKYNRGTCLWLCNTVRRGR